LVSLNVSKTWGNGWRQRKNVASREKIRQWKTGLTPLSKCALQNVVEFKNSGIPGRLTAKSWGWSVKYISKLVVILTSYWLWSHLSKLHRVPSKSHRETPSPSSLREWYLPHNIVAYFFENASYSKFSWEPWRSPTSCWTDWLSARN
jgi:hypothetical protein